MFNVSGTRREKASESQEQTQCKVLKFMGRKKYNLVAVPYFQARDNKSYYENGSVR